MNSISSASSSRVAESLAYIGGSSDAIALQEATQYYMTDKIRDALKKTLVNSGNLLQNLLQFNELKARVNTYTSGAVIGVTPEDIKNTLGDNDKLKNLFLNDGPKLGSTLEESNILFDELLALGLVVAAPLALPVLMTTLDKTGNVLSTSFSNMSKSEREALNSFDKIDMESAASEVREHVIPPPNKDDNPITIRYEAFDDYANLRPEINDINLAKFFLSDKETSLNAQFTKQLLTAQKTSEKLDSLIENHIKNSKEQSIRVSESQVLLQQVVVDLLYKLRQLKLDSEVRAPNNTEIISKLGLADSSNNDVLAMIKNMSDRVESVSTLQNSAIHAADINVSSKNISSLSGVADLVNLVNADLNSDIDVESLNFPLPLIPEKYQDSESITPSLPGLRGELPGSDNFNINSVDKKNLDLAKFNMSEMSTPSTKD